MASAAPPKRVVSSVFITLASPHRATVTPQQQPALQAHSAPAREKLHPAVRVSPGDSIPALRHSREDKSPPSESNGGLKIKGLTNAGSSALVSGLQSHNPPKHEPGKTQLQEKNDQRSSSGIYYILDFFLLVKKTIYKILENGPARPFIGSSPDQNDNLCISWPAFQNIWSQNVKYWFYTSKRLLKEPKKISSPFPRQGLSLVLDLKKKKINEDLLRKVSRLNSCLGNWAHVLFSHYEPPEQLQLSLALILQVFDFYWRNQQILLKDVPYLYLFLFLWWWFSWRYEIGMT